LKKQRLRLWTLFGSYQRFDTSGAGVKVTVKQQKEKKLWKRYVLSAVGD